MKILYSQIKELVPDLSARPAEVAEALTMIGMMQDSFQEVDYRGRSDYLVGLEIRQNRPDCLSVMGLAREVAAYYGLPFQAPEGSLLEYSDQALDIKVKSKREVQRILAVRLSGLHNQASPDWLQEFLAFYDIKSINLLVDLSNYVMIYTGYPSHLLDASKLSGDLSWSVNKDRATVQTLDQTELALPGQELVISDEENILALAGLVGCLPAAIEANTTEVIAEMAVYDRSLIMQNSRSLGVVTEASNRLSKDLDPAGVEAAFAWLVSLLLQHGQGKIASQLFSYYPEPRLVQPISLDPELPSRLAGLDISQERVIEILENLRFTVTRETDSLLVTPPADRSDVSLPEDLAEEVIRLNRFDLIPSHEVPVLTVTPDITPQLYFLKEKMRDYLVALSYDEILSQPLVGVDVNLQTNWQDWQSLTTQNSVNEEYPDLRQSMASGLLNQLDVYVKKNLSYIKIFEIGKVFGRQGRDYQEHDSLGILAYWPETLQRINDFKNDVEKLLRHLGLTDLSYQPVTKLPPLANPYVGWQIVSNNQPVGLLYKLKPQHGQDTGYFCELNLPQVLDQVLTVQTQATVEIIKKLVVLDANLEVASRYQLFDYFQKLKNKIGQDHLWSLEVVDEYVVDNSRIRYTIRVTYQDLSDQEAKELHANIFNLS